MRGEQRAQHEKTAMRKIDDARDAKDQRQPRRHQEQRGGVGQAAKELDENGAQGQCSIFVNATPNWLAAA